jgi:hypothetical protein
MRRAFAAKLHDILAEVRLDRIDSAAASAGFSSISSVVIDLPLTMLRALRPRQIDDITRASPHPRQRTPCSHFLQFVGELNQQLVEARGSHRS